MSDLENSFPEHSPAAAATALTGGGQMGALIRSTDWSERPPGRIDFWPQSLRLALRIMLDRPTRALSGGAKRESISTMMRQSRCSASATPAP